MFTREELETALAAGYEGRGFELKGPGSCDDRHFQAKVTKVSLSMGNLRDGGHVVVGIDDNAPQDLLPGLTDDQRATWSYDDVASRMNAYSDPPLSFDLREVELSTGVTVVVIRVSEFEVVPHLCIRAFESTLRAGALYVRTRTMPATTEVASSSEMREVLDLAAEKRLRAYVEHAERAGVRLTTTDEADDRERFEAQARGLFDE